ncbi:non-ribosomal peptide synthetase [Streptomyces sp. GbtcB6]|uniref:non-ribosomal peptide synthetase n=1 Tax=Streptomyces sp. GbtcB6 TaxID=2824751 RepID=UPI001C30891F|nr:non-ribosomal peptide synthetase [Streptomyces sp. GbtcB6]
MTPDLTAGQRRVAAAQRPEAAAFWTSRLADATPVGFPADRPSDDRASHRHTAELPLDADTGERLQAVSRGDAEAAAVLLASVAVALLRSFAGVDDLVIGRLPGAPGGLADIVPLRTTLADDDSLAAVAARLGAAVGESRLYEDYPVELVADLPEVVVLGDAMPADDRLPAADTFIGFGAARRSIVVRVDGDRFLPESAHLLAERCRTLLAAALDAPRAPLAGLDLRTEHDRRTTEAANDTASPFPDQVTLSELFALTMAARPGQTAIVTPERAYTYAELDHVTAHLAARLRSAGVGRDVIVGVLAERSFAALAGILAVIRAGGAYLPLDPSLPQERLAHMVSDSRTGLVLADAASAGRLPGAGATVIALDDAVREAFEAEPADPVPFGSPDDTAYVIYTSGSTGLPKGVVVEHRSVVNRLHWMQRTYPLGADDVILHKTPTAFDVSVWELFWWLIEGAAVCLLEPRGEREPGAIVEAIDRFGVTVLHFVPTMLGAFLDYVGAAGAASRLAPLRRVFSSGEALGRHHVTAFHQLGTGAELVNLYGPTEATVDVSHHRTAADDTVVPIGLPIDNTRLYVLDAAGRELPVGMPGELYIAGAGLARGYLHREELTAERFVTDPLPGEDRAYRTGDLVRRLPDGAIEYLGRIDFQVKLRGYRIELGEIEQRLLAHPEVTDAVVVLRTGDDGQGRLYGYVVCAGDVAEDDLRAHAAVTLPAYMVPERIVPLAAFPLSPNGKLDRSALPEPAVRTAEYVAPGSEAERALAGIWAEVLGVARVGATDSFFALGGNSIHFVSVLAKARKEGLEFTFQQLFAHPTVRELAAGVGEAAAGDAPPTEFGAFELISDRDRALVPEGVEDAYPMAMLQSGLIYQSEIMHGNTSYHDIISYLIQSSIDPGLFREAVRILVERNPIFRTSYHLHEYAEYLQLVHERIEELPLVVHDIRHLDRAKQDAWYDEWFHREQNRPFDWDKPGLFRFHIHVLSDELYRYSVSQHNSALDGWSINQVHVQLFGIYYALLEGRTVDTPQVVNHLRNFIGLERHAIDSPDFQEFWRKALDGRPHTEIPRLRPAEADERLDVVFRDIELPDGLSDRIVALAGRLGVPVKNVLLAAHLRVHTLLCGNLDVITGYEHGGRPELPGADRALGVFLNTMPLRVKVAEGTWTELIRQTYRSEAELLPYRRYPMAKVKQDQRTTDPLFETVFNFTHFHSLKALKELPEFALLDVRAAAITEFPLRAEFSQHFYTDEVQLSLHYHTGVFDTEHIERIGGYYRRALMHMVDTPDAPHHSAELLDETELAELAAFSAPHTDATTVVDAAGGTAAPIGTTGDVVVSGRPTGRRGFWRPDGVVEFVDHDNSAAAVEEAPSAPATARLTVRPDTEDALAPFIERIRAVWAGVLETEPDGIGIDDDFFDIGGNSLAALRVSVQLKEWVSLRDVMRSSILRELAEAAAEKAGTAPAEEGTLLARFTEPANAAATVVLLPYAGGNAVHFRPVAQELARRDSTVAVAAAELPGHAPGASGADLLPFDEICSRLAAEIDATTSGPLVLWGHCVGSALALALARLLTERGRTVRHLFLAAKLLADADTIRDTLGNAERLSFGDVRDLVVDWTGSTAIDSAEEATRDLLVRTFRHDSLTANTYLLGLRTAPPEPLDVPCTVVIAADDPATEGYGEAYGAWETAVRAPRLAELTHGGHYFARTRPEAVADLLATAVHETPRT